MRSIRSRLRDPQERNDINRILDDMVRSKGIDPDRLREEIRQEISTYEQYREEVSKRVL